MALRDHMVLTFDVVGTLIDFESGIVDCLESVVRDGPREPDGQSDPYEQGGPDGRRRSGRGGGPRRAGTADALPERAVLLEAVGRAEERQQLQRPQMPYSQMLEPVYEEVATEFGLPSQRTGSAVLRDSIPHWPPFPDAVETLAWLRRRFRLVALTNSDRWGLERMSATLGDPFHDAVTAEDVGVNKPSPRVFDYCRGRLSAAGFWKTDILHVAQSQYHDIVPAKGLGLATCWIERRGDVDGWGATPAPKRPVTPDAHFASLEGLRQAIERDQ